MTYQRDFDDLLREWADHGDERLPDRFLQAALQEIETTRQRGAPWASLEGLIMRLQPAAPLLGVAAVAIAAVALYFAFAQPNVGDREASPTPMPSSAPQSVAPSVGPSAQASIEPRPLPAGTAAAELGLTPTAIRAGEDALYAAVGDQIVRIDPETLEATAVVNVPETERSCSDCLTGSGQYAFDVGDGSAWVAYHLEDQSLVRRFDLTDGSLQAEILLGTPGEGGGGADDIVFAFGSVWTAQCHSATAARIDPATNEQVALIDLPTEQGGCHFAFSVGAGPDSVWVGGTVFRDFDTAGPVIARIDPVANEVVASYRPSSLVQSCGRFATDAASVWVASCTDSNARGIVRIDPAQDTADDPIRLGGLPGDPMLHDGLVWVPVVAGSPTGSAMLVAVDPATGAVVDAIALSDSVSVTAKTAVAAVVAFDAAWVHVGGGTVLRIPLSELSAS